MFTDAPGTVEVTALRGIDIKAISGGDGHILMLTADGRVYAMGTNGDGQLGNGNWLNDSNLPILLGLERVTYVAASRHTSMAIVGSRRR